MSALEVWPAIDLLDRRPTRLYQGSFDKRRAYPQSVYQLIDELSDLKVPRLHLVDLTGAKTGQFSAWEALGYATRRGLMVEVGGGFRDVDTIDRALKEGASAVVLGTALIADLGWGRDLMNQFGRNQIVVGLDVLKGRARTDGWTQVGPDAVQLWQDLREQGFCRVNVTDIEHDGSLNGVRPEFWKPWGLVWGDIGAGGGVRSLTDLNHLQQWGLKRVIIGKAWLEGRIDLSQMAWGEP